jgi:Cu-processing system ATP-binding protein
VGYHRRSPVLHDLTFRSGPGEVLSVVGANGAGKTTLFRTLLGFLRPSSGKVRVGGLPPALFRRRHGFAYLPDSLAFPSGWSGTALLREGVRIAGLPRGRGRGALDLAVDRTGLSTAELDGPWEALSKGMARRVGLALVLVGEPQVLLLDEPLTGLDAPSRVRLRDEILQAAARGAVVVLASHDLDEVERIAHRALLLRSGLLERVLERRELERGGLEELVAGRAPRREGGA